MSCGASVGRTGMPPALERLLRIDNILGGPTGNGHDRVVTVVKDGEFLSGIMLRLTVF